MINKQERFRIVFMQVWNKVDNIDGVDVGDEAEIFIDEETRCRNAKLHSAGHLLDLAVQNLSIKEIDYF